MSQDILSDEDCKNILKERFGPEEVKLVSYTIKSPSENIDGLGGDHYKLEIFYESIGERKVEHFFLKTKPRKTETQNDISNNMNTYPQEIFLYNVLLHEFAQSGFDTSFAPKCYYCVPGESLIMEDLQLDGFRLPDMYKFFDLEQFKRGLESLANLHAAGFMYEEMKTKELGRPFRLDAEYPEYLAEDTFFSRPSRDNSYGLQWLGSGANAFSKLIDYLPESEEYKTEFRKRLDAREIGKIFFEEHNIRKTLTHGDLWTNNIFFKSEDGVAKKCCFVDYQLSRYFYPAFDILFFIYVNSKREFGQDNMKYLLDYYYTELSDVMHKHGYDINDIYPKKDFVASLDIVKFDAKVQSLTNYSLRCYSREFIADQVNSGGGEMNDFLFGDRSPQMIKVFNSDEGYRNLVTGCLYDLHDILFKKEGLYSQYVL